MKTYGDLIVQHVIDHARYKVNEAPLHYHVIWYGKLFTSADTGDLVRQIKEFESNSTERAL